MTSGMSYYQGKQGVSNAARVMVRAADGVTGMTKQLNMGTLQSIFLPSTSNFNTWIGEQLDLWSQELLVREAQRLNFWKDEEKNSG